MNVENICLKCVFARCIFYHLSYFMIFRFLFVPRMVCSEPTSNLTLSDLYMASSSLATAASACINEKKLYKHEKTSPNERGNNLLWLKTLSSSRLFSPPVYLLVRISLSMSAGHFNFKYFMAASMAKKWTTQWMYVRHEYDEPCRPHTMCAPVYICRCLNERENQSKCYDWRTFMP